jgi:serine/threonine protein phosphatase PrpC
MKTSVNLHLTAADKSDVGRQREQNEDCAYKRIESSENGDRGLFIVADGMGGYKAGEVASRLAIETIQKNLDTFFKPIVEQPTVQLDRASITRRTENGEQNEASSHKTGRLPEVSITASIEEQLKSAIQQANTEIVRYGEKKTSARGLGSTVTAALIQNNQAYIANVGDSRTYRLHNKELNPVTRDHSLVARLVESKQIGPEEVYTHPQRNLIYRSLGAGHKTVEVDVFQVELIPGDALLLCSDGLWEMVRQQDLVRILNEQSSPEKACDMLIDLANQNGGEDNITAVIVRVSAH